jgi:AcrR family transcriptional regulator
VSGTEAGGDRRAEIVDAAYRCVADKGLYGLRMRDVAAAAGVNIATVHYHLTSKADLIRAVVEYANGRFRREAAPPDDPDPVRRLRAHLDRLFALLVEDPRLGNVLADIALHARRDRTLAEIVAGAEEGWLGTLREMMAPLPRRETDAVARLVMLVVKGACLPPVRADELAAAHRELVDHLERRLGADRRPATG